MKKIALSMGLLMLCFLGFAAAPGGPARAALETVLTGDDHKTSLCHATGNSDTFPAGNYVLIPPSEAGAVFGHLGAGHQNGNDIIPPFEYEGQTYSQHWDAVGQAIFAAGCGEPDDTTTTTTTIVTEPPKPPCPVTPSNPTGALPNPPGGKDGELGNDECKPDEPPITTTSTTSTTPTTPAPTTPAPTTPAPTTPEPTTTEETTPDEPAGQSSKPDKPSKSNKPRSTPDTTPTSEEKLPLTGFPLFVIALFGVTVLAGGFALRKLRKL